MAYHIPVLLEETLRLLDPRPGKTYIDATLGGGGHAEDILKRIKGKGTLIGIDRDEDAIEEAGGRLKEFGTTVKLVRENFANIKKILNDLNIKKANGIIFDLGVSSHQLDEANRGFSMQKEGPLDMRMDVSRGISAKEAVNSFPAEELSEIISEFGEERNARRIAKFIVNERREAPISTTLELKETINKALKGLPPKIIFDATTRVFQAFRIYVNDELNNLTQAIKDSIDVLSAGGRLIVISYHSLEDRIVKKIFKEEATDCICPARQPVCTCSHEKRIKILTKKPVVPDESEISANPRSRSAKLRAAERV
jgi:16S rRNA (cytosine1402-N4)-methyltransferase